MLMPKLGNGGSEGSEMLSDGQGIAGSWKEQLDAKEHPWRWLWR